MISPCLNKVPAHCTWSVLSTWLFSLPSLCRWFLGHPCLASITTPWLCDNAVAIQMKSWPQPCYKVLPPSLTLSSATKKWLLKNSSLLYFLTPWRGFLEEECLKIISLFLSSISLMCHSCFHTSVFNTPPSSWLSLPCPADFTVVWKHKTGKARTSARGREREEGGIFFLGLGAGNKLRALI